MLSTIPCVFAVEDTYQIFVGVEKPSLMWVEVGGKRYYDETNGILKSAKDVHRMTVPAKELDAAKAYTIYEREIIDRKAYFTETADAAEYHYEFSPVTAKKPRAYHISDTHGLVEPAVAAAETYGKIDFLILNGDISDSSNDTKNFYNIYRIAGKITQGRLPIVFSRGNHDMRGKGAEFFADYTPTHNGKSYYTFRLGSVWGIVLDSGEDKPDCFPEYGHTISCHEFRERETEFIKDVIANAENTYLADGIKTRIVIAHNPFTEQLNPPFNIEPEIFSEWARLLRESIKPNAMLCGHMHRLYISRPGDEHDHLGNPSPVAVSATLNHEKQYFAGGGFEFDGDKISGAFTSSEGEILEAFEL